MTCKKRLFRALGWLGAAAAAALAYLSLIRVTGKGLGCPFQRAAGLFCPGCGVSRMCLRLLEPDLFGAFRANPLLFAALPLIAGLLLARAVRYVKKGERGTPRWEERTWIALAAAFLAYGVLRNLPALAFLAPA